MGEVRKLLLGKELVFTKEMDLFNSLRKKYLQLSVEARKKADEVYDANLDGYASYVALCRSIMNDVFDTYLQIGVADIIRYGIYDIDEVVLRQEFEAEIGSEYGQKVDEFVGRIEAIDAEQAAADQERKDMIRNSGPIEGSYVSMSGNFASDMGNIVGNQIETAAINAVFKGGTALLTAGVRAIEKKAAEKERNALFSKSSTKNDVLEGMEQDVYMLHRTIARLINERTGVEHYYYAKEADVLRFEPICRNVLRGNFKAEDLPGLETEQIHKVLMMNPYELRMFCYVMKENGGITDELKNLMDYLCVDKASLADTYLEEKFSLADYSTYEAMVEFEKVVAAELVQFGVTECNFTYDVASKKETLYIARRTFRQFTYDTIEERDFAEKQFYEFLGEGFMELELDELLEKYDATYDNALTEKNRDDFQAMLLEYISVKVDEFRDTESIAGYVTYAQGKKLEHGLEKSELLDVFERKYKKLNRKEKFNAGAAAAKEKLAATAGSVMGKGKGFIKKLPFGKKKKEEVIDGTAVELSSETVTAATEEGTAKPKKEKKKLNISGVKDKLPKKEKGSTDAEQESEAAIAKVVEEHKLVTPEAAAEEKSAVVETKEEATPVAAPASVTENPTVAPATKPCPQCGAAVKATGKFCSKCGYRF
ncbi:MAG: hypothetical protein J6J38_05335 [Lachnospiraceae bacterium]|nr:hypothetical protein [Lachnospiraceae bacterium]